MAGFNRAVLLGRLTADPELKQTVSGVSVTSFTLAVDRRYKNGEEPQADFIPIVCWRQTAEFVSRYFRGAVRSSSADRYRSANGRIRTDKTDTPPRLSPTRCPSPAVRRATPAQETRRVRRRNTKRSPPTTSFRSEAVAQNGKKTKLYSVLF